MQDKNTAKDHLIDIASDLFCTQGFHQTGIKQIIEEAKIAKGTFYSHFKSKDDLGVEWLKKLHVQSKKDVLDHLKAIKKPKEKILAFFSFYEKWMCDCEFRGCPFMNTYSEITEKDSKMSPEAVNHRAFIKDWLEAAVREHETDISEAELDLKTKTISLLFSGSLLEAQCFQDCAPIATAKQAVEKILS